nr:skin secretory protein xP2-like [Equus caballus]
MALPPARPPCPHPGHRTCPRCQLQGGPGATGEEREGETARKEGGDRKGQPASEVEGVSRRASRSPAFARSAEWAGTRGAPGGLGEQPSRKGSGRGQLSPRRRGDSGPALKVGEGVPSRAPAASDINKATHGERAAAPTQPARALPQRPAPRPAAARRAGPPGPQAPARPRGRAERGKFPAAPGPGLQRREVPAQLTSPRREQQRGPGRSRSDSSARLSSALQRPRPLPAHPARPAAPLRSGHPPAEAAFAPTWPASLPLRDTALTYAAAATTRPGFPAREGSAGARQPASEGARLGTHPRRPPPAPSPPQAPRAHAAARRPRAPAPSPRPHRAPAIRTPGRS